MDCGNARLLLLFYRPGRTSELTPEDISALESHLQSCPECSARFQRESAWDRSVETAVKAVPIPGDLRAGLLSSSQAIVKAKTRHQFAQRLLMSAAVVTAGLLAWGGYLRATREVLDTESLVYQVDQTFDSRENVARIWLNRLSLPLPESLDLRMVQSVGEVRLQNRTVPGMLLIQPTTGQVAWVYFLPPGSFDLQQATNAQASNATARIYKDQQGGWAVLIIYTGNDLRPFIRDNPQTA